ncbi:Arm DNA-binding domain-containing protein [Mariniflexile sp. HNIBRBA6329]|uniref:Arm DNA-binding domain-containing protein n=1 Tax=Mariniflexile sp. HNIBRBA6329 TaxID=3373088 RepID=UPI003744F89C
MTRSNTFNILFWLKLASAKNRKAPLYARIKVKGKRSELFLKQRISIFDWDTAKSRLKVVSDENKLVNGYLE